MGAVHHKKPESTDSEAAPARIIHRPRNLAHRPLFQYSDIAIAAWLAASHRALGRGVLQALQSAIHQGALQSAPLSRKDPVHWSQVAVNRNGGGRLKAFCARALKIVETNPATLPLIDEALRHSRKIPSRRAIRRYVRLRRLKIPRALALRLA